MSDDDLPPDLRVLFDAERRAPTPPRDTKARVRHALAASLGGGGFGPDGAPPDAGSGASGAPPAGSMDAAGAGSAVAGGGGATHAAIGGTQAAIGAGAAKSAVTAGVLSAPKLASLAVATAIAGAAGYGGVKAVRVVTAPTPIVAPAPLVKRPEPPALLEPPPRLPDLAPAIAPLPAEPPSPPSLAAKPAPAKRAPTATRAPPAAVPPAAEEPEAASSGAAQPAPASAPVRTPEERASRLREERSLLEGARRALAGGSVAPALTAIAEHEARFADGALVEEREALRVQALVRAERAEEARAALARFKARFPSSLFTPALDALLP